MTTARLTVLSRKRYTCRVAATIRVADGLPAVLWWVVLVSVSSENSIKLVSRPVQKETPINYRNDRRWGDNFWRRFIILELLSPTERLAHGPGIACSGYRSLLFYAGRVGR